MNTEAFQTIFKEHTGEALVETSPILGRGRVNQVYLLRSAVSTYIVRLSTESDLTRFRKEAWCMEQATSLGIPGPTVLGIGLFEAGTYMLLTFVPGEYGADVSEEQTLHVWHTLGRYAQAIHHIPVSGFGERMGEGGVFADSWSNYLQDNLHDIQSTGRLVTGKILTTAQAAELSEMFVALRRMHFSFGLIHQDLSLKNTLVRADGKVSLLDWGSARVSVIPHMEFEEILTSGNASTSPAFTAFLEGYGLEEEDFKKIEPEIHALRLLMYIDKIRWALDQSPDRLPSYVSKLHAELGTVSSI